MVFTPIFSSWLILLIVLGLTVFLVWQESKKTHRFRVFRITTVLLMMSALSGILLKPGYKTKPSSSIVLLTDHYSKDQVDSILLHDHHATLMHLEGTSSYKSSKKLEAHALPQLGSQIKLVLGDGLTREQLDAMTDVTFTSLPSTLPIGITNLVIPRESVVGRETSIKGTLNSARENYWIYLEGPGGREDSVEIQKKGLNEFVFSFTPKHDGKFAYHLLQGDSINGSREMLPVFVKKQRNLNVIFLQSYPTFETQTLKNFLGHKNHSIVVRNQVSKNNFRYEYINRDAVQIGRLSAELLKETDLIILDDKSLATLTPAEKNILTNAIHSGLGLLNLSTTSVKKETLFPFQTIMVKKDTTIISVRSKLLTLPASKIRVNANSSAISLQKNKSGVLSGYGFLGAGKIGFQLLQETYQISLSGDSLTYAALWTPLLENIARAKYQASKINITTPFPWYEDEPIDIEVISSTEEITLDADNIPLPLREDIAVDNVWHTRTWAGQSGWHTLETSDGTSLNYFVSPSNEWRSLNLINQQQANKLYKSRNAQSSTEIEITEEIPPLIFYLIFLLSVGFLWLAPKL